MAEVMKKVPDFVSEAVARGYQTRAEVAAALRLSADAIEVEGDEKRMIKCLVRLERVDVEPDPEPVEED